jgi:hypothetical protein
MRRTSSTHTANLFIQSRNSIFARRFRAATSSASAAPSSRHLVRRSAIETCVPLPMMSQVSCEYFVSALAGCPVDCLWQARHEAGIEPVSETKRQSQSGKGFSTQSRDEVLCSSQATSSATSSDEVPLSNPSQFACEPVSRRVLSSTPGKGILRPEISGHSRRKCAPKDTQRPKCWAHIPRNVRKYRTLFRCNLLFKINDLWLVEPRGIEPLTSAVRLQRSPI